MGRKQSITESLQASLSPSHLEVLDESHRHSVPVGAESHFRVIVVAESFGGVSRPQRHRMINAAVAEVFAGGLHALAIEARTPEEWAARNGPSTVSPPCLGGDGPDGSWK